MNHQAGPLESRVYLCLSSSWHILTLGHLCVSEWTRPSEKLGTPPPPAPRPRPARCVALQSREVPTTFNEMFLFNAAVMGFSSSGASEEERDETSASARRAEGAADRLNSLSLGAPRHEDILGPGSPTKILQKGGVLGKPTGKQCGLNWLAKRRHAVSWQMEGNTCGPYPGGGFFLGPAALPLVRLTPYPLAVAMAPGAMFV